MEIAETADRGEKSHGVNDLCNNNSLLSHMWGSRNLLTHTLTSIINSKANCASDAGQFLGNSVAISGAGTRVLAARKCCLYASHSPGRCHVYAEGSPNSFVAAGNSKGNSRQRSQVGKKRKPQRGRKVSAQRGTGELPRIKISAMGQDG